ncbi:hypothetical protein [Clostridium sp.]|jgi:hypothetical protein|uniref:hypothetical protein n=1 Tax=Clostridium sp. TaxID=1506 RepID=UPI002FDC7DCC
MKMRKGNFLTTFFSFLPGAGHMYMGFMKMGLSLMSAFFFVIFLSTWLNMGPLLFVLPLIWFYSFFDCLNKQSLPEEEFVLLEDNYMFSLDEFLRWDKNLFKKRRLFFGILMILLGIYLIWDNIIYIIEPYMDREVYILITSFTRIAPQVIVAVAIIIIGAKLIMGKKKERSMYD